MRRCICGEIMVDGCMDPEAARTLEARLKTFAADFDARFDAYLAGDADVSDVLLEAVRYAALAPGKRIRPYLVVRCCTLVGGRPEDAWPVAAAVECVHAFSLVHDDLPAMDDDDLRRGLPTCHKQFGEAVAILAGDALVVLAFELLSAHVPDGALASRMVRIIAEGAGWRGMIGGQSADLAGEDKPPTRSLVESIHARKTAALFAAACRLGALAGRGSEEHVNALARYGQRIGRAFQIADDLLDVTSHPNRLGKATQKDLDAGKQTILRCVGTEESRRLALEHVAGAKADLATFGAAADELRALADYVVRRGH